MSKVTQLRGVLDDLPDALFGVDRSGSIRFANRLAESLFGYQRDDVVGSPFETLVPEALPLVQSAYKKDAKGKGARPARSSLKLSGLHRDGTEFPVDIALSTVGAGDEMLAVVAVRDMTRHQSAESKRRLVRDVAEGKRAFDAAQSMIETSQDALVAISPEGKITDANGAMVKITGVQRDELIGTSFSYYFTDPGKAEEVYQLVLKEEGSLTDYPLTLRHVDGHDTYTEVRYNASVYRDAGGNVRGVFASARDVTEQVQAQRAQAEQQAAAEDRLEELERFQRLTVGRELRMIQLKKEIEELKRFSEAKETTLIDPD